jgi:hypothetical protein
MYHFYAQISAPQRLVGTLFTHLAALTRLSRKQIRVFSADADWSSWGI